MCIKNTVSPKKLYTLFVNLLGDTVCSSQMQEDCKNISTKYGENFSRENNFIKTCFAPDVVKVSKQQICAT